MKKLYYILLLLSFAIGGCKKHLELAPVSSITSASFFKNENDVNGALYGMYYNLRNEAVLNLYIYGEARSEEMTGSVAGALGYDKYYNNSLLSTNPGPTWANLYTIVNQANLLIKYIPTITFTSADNQNKDLAQAYAMRAFIYFVLARTWGDVPLRLTPMESYDPATVQVPRTAVADIFKQIKSDIDQSLKLFPNNTFPSGRNTWSKLAVNALKGDVYLWTGKLLNGGTADFTTALAALNTVQSSDVQLLPNFADVFDYAKKGNNEILMAVQFRYNEGPTSTVDLNLYTSLSSYPEGVPASQISTLGVPGVGNGCVWRLSDVVRNQFTDDDTRKSATYIDIISTKTGYYTSFGLKSNGTVISGKRYFVSDYILYRYADVLLMKAEAKNALGQDPSAEINQIRQRAYGANYSNHVFVNGTKAQNDDTILKERLFEFCLEGKRWWDEIRFGKVFDLVPSLAGKQSQTYLTVFPVGTSVLTRETLVTETPGWN